MKAFYCDHFILPLPSKHRFPMAKYARLRERVSALEPAAHLLQPEGVSDEMLLRAHGADYVRQVVAGELPARSIRRLGFPWSPQLVERSRRSSGGTLAAARAALAGDRVAVNLAGGTHHAFADRGEGFCVFNDAAVTVRQLQHEGRIRRALIIDCDVHQGNGTASIFADDPSAFTLSLHGRRNYPFHKETSDLDVEFADGTEDSAYLDALELALDRVFPVAGADLVIYLAGADPFVDDKLGRLALSRRGLERRDAMVFERCRAEDLPVVVTMAGGYAPEIDDIVDIHFTTVRLAFESFRAERVTARQ